MALLATWGEGYGSQKLRVRVSLCQELGVMVMEVRNLG
jgi:hypothetical protein